MLILNLTKTTGNKSKNREKELKLKPFCTTNPIPKANPNSTNHNPNLKPFCTNNPNPNLKPFCKTNPDPNLKPVCTTNPNPKPNLKPF